MTSQTAVKAQKALKQVITLTPKEATRFFKVGKGDYAEHDKFIGVTLPNIRKVAKQFESLSFSELQVLFNSKCNEERLLVLIVLTKQYQQSDLVNQTVIYNFYLKNLKNVNNWNLVDASAHLILGAYLANKRKEILLNLAKSDVLWERRIAIVSTWYFIKQGKLTWTFKLAKKLLQDEHDLIHKAVGWMLREAGKQDESRLCIFLDEYVCHMPRTMLRYAIERFPEKKRKAYLNIKKSL